MENESNALEVFHNHGISAESGGKGIIRVRLQRGAAVYYLKQQSWQHRGRNFNGTPKQMAQWVRQERLL